MRNVGKGDGRFPAKPRGRQSIHIAFAASSSPRYFAWGSARADARCGPINRPKGGEGGRKIPNERKARNRSQDSVRKVYYESEPLRVATNFLPRLTTHMGLTLVINT